MFPHIDAHYLPHVLPLRAERDKSIESLLFELADDRALVHFLMSYCSMRIGTFRPISGWLRKSARLGRDAGDDEVGDELCRAAEREEEHRLFLIADLVSQREVWTKRLGGHPIGLLALVRRLPNPTTARHVELRHAVSEDPFAMIAVELELAEFGRAFGPALVQGAHVMLGDAAEDCLRFVQARTEDAVERSHARQRRLELLLARDPSKGEVWAARSGELVRSYCEVLIASTAHGHLRTPPSGSASSAGFLLD